MKGRFLCLGCGYPGLAIGIVLRPFSIEAVLRLLRQNCTCRLSRKLLTHWTLTKDRNRFLLVLCKEYLEAHGT